MRTIFLLATVVILGISSMAHAQYGGDPTRSYIDQMVRDNMNLRRAQETRRAGSKKASQRNHKEQGSQARSLRSKPSSLNMTYPPPLVSVSPKVPTIKGLSYDAARKKLLAAGWKPRLQPLSYEQSPNIQGGNGSVFWKRGYTEITDSSGTGKGFCRFQFKDAQGRLLTVVTVGEEDLNGTSKAVVDSHSIQASHKK
jgi:hypothetical protein